MSSSKDWVNTALVAAGAAAFSTIALLALRGSSNNQSDGYSGGCRCASTAPRVERATNKASNTSSPEFGGVGFSMEEAKLHAQAGAAAAAARCPTEVLEDLAKGNARFWTGNANRPEVSAFERRALINMQYPSTVVLGCSDSRVPIEIVFDQGLGDLFVIRVAGNCLDTTTQASLEYAVHHLAVKVLVVMGHEGCGAVKAAGLPMDAINKESTALSNLLKDLKSGLDEDRLNHVWDPRARDREAVVSNVRRQVESLCMEEGIMKAVKAGNLIIVGAFYEISSGIVDFFHEVSKQDLSLANGLKSGAGSKVVQSRFDPDTKSVTFKPRYSAGK